MKTTDKRTVGSLLFQGVNAIDAICSDCGHKWSAPIDFMPTAATVNAVASLLFCNHCNGRDIHVTTGRTATELN